MKKVLLLLVMICGFSVGYAQSISETVLWITQNDKRSLLNEYESYSNAVKNGKQKRTVTISKTEITLQDQYGNATTLPWNEVKDVKIEDLHIMIIFAKNSAVDNKPQTIWLKIDTEDYREQYAKAIKHLAALSGAIMVNDEPVYGALAVDLSNGAYYAFNTDVASLAGAQKYALKECTDNGGKCTLVLAWQGKACAVYRTVPGDDAGSAYGWGLAATKEAADAIALSEAKKRSKGVSPSILSEACNSVGIFKEIKPGITGK